MCDHDDELVDPQPAVDAAEQASRRPHSVARSVLVAVCVAVTGSAALAVAECCVAAWTINKSIQGTALPADVTLSAIGRAAAAHVPLWCVVMAACGLAGSVLRRRAGGFREPFLWAFFVLVAGAVVLPSDLWAARHRGLNALAVAYAATAVAGVVTFLVLAFVSRRLGPDRIRKVSHIAAGVSGMLLVGVWAVAVRSPLFDVAGYQVPPPAADGRTEPRRNVLWIVLDTVRADRMSCYGYAEQTTPFLDEWSRRAIVFDRAVADGIWTVPSHASMFSGLSLRQHGVDGHVTRLDDKFRTVAEVLQSGGYQTVMFSNNPWLSPDTNFTKGFDTYYAMHRMRCVSGFSLKFLCDRRGITPPVPWLEDDNGAALTNQLVARWLDRDRAPDQPFLLFVNYMEGHLPYEAPRKYRRMYLDDAQVDRSFDLRHSVVGNIVQALTRRFNLEGGDFMDPADIEIMRRQYLAALRYLDGRVGELIDMLDRRSLLDDTLIVIAADHGEYLDTHGMWSHRMHTYNDVTHVPLMIRDPGRAQGLRVSTPAQLSDLYPTIINWALRRSDQGPGYGTQDLLALASAGEVPRVVIAQQAKQTPEALETLRRFDNPALMYRAKPRVAAVDNRFKYIVSGAKHQELYDTIADPQELQNSLDLHPREADRLAEYIRLWRAMVPKYEPPQTPEAEAMDTTNLDALRDLGYLGGG